MAAGSQNSLVDAAKAAGVVGAGGAGFPTHVKVAAQVEIVIANGAECEPLLRVDQQLMVRFPEKIVSGLAKVREATGAKRAVIGLKAKYKDAFRALESHAKKAGIELFGLGAFYPAGDEVTLVYEVTGRIIPEAGLPLSVGCVVQNVHTLMWLDEASAGCPATERWLTVGGAVRNPVTLCVPIGTPVGDVLAAAGGPAPGAEDHVILDGGPMMGKFVDDCAVVTKRTSGILIFPRNHPYVLKRGENMRISWKKAAAACTVCEDCTKYCPRFLLGHRVLPHRAMRSSSHAPEPPPMDGFALTGAICCECGICTLWSCPMDLRPREVMQAVKRKMSATKTVNPFKGQDGPIHPSYDERKIPVDRLIKGLFIEPWDVPAPWRTEKLQPAAVRIPLSQHLGAPAQPTVQVGEKVKAGELIGEIPANALGARVHASIDGVVTEVSDFVRIERRI